MSNSDQELALSDELAALEQALQSVVPAMPNVSRERLMFLAGQRSVAPTRSGHWFWPTIAAAMTLLSLGLWLSDRRSEAVFPSPPRDGRPSASTLPYTGVGAGPIAPSEYFRLSRNEMHADSPAAGDPVRASVLRPTPEVSAFHLRRELFRGQQADEPLLYL